jgi:hypothetical protein
MLSFEQVFPLCVVEGRLELSATQIMFFPERLGDEEPPLMSTPMYPATGQCAVLFLLFVALLCFYDALNCALRLTYIRARVA